MKTGITIWNKGNFLFNYSTRPKKNILVILMLKLFLTTKHFGKPYGHFVWQRSKYTQYNARRKQRNSTHGRKNIKDTRRENIPTNKFEALTKSMNMYVSAIGALNQLFIRDSYTQVKFSKKWSSQWQKCIFCDRSVLYSPFNLS